MRYIIMRLNTQEFLQKTCFNLVFFFNCWVLQDFSTKLVSSHLLKGAHSAKCLSSAIFRWENYLLKKKLKSVTVKERKPPQMTEMLSSRSRHCCSRSCHNIQQCWGMYGRAGSVWAPSGEAPGMWPGWTDPQTLCSGHWKGRRSYIQMFCSDFTVWRSL